MLLSTCQNFWTPVRDSLLPAVDAVQLAIVLWVASRTRSMSQGERWTSQVLQRLYVGQHQLLGRSGSPEPVQVPRKSSTRATTYTSPGEHLDQGDGP